jgi:hypothetical protein
MGDRHRRRHRSGPGGPDDLAGLAAMSELTFAEESWTPCVALDELRVGMGVVYLFPQNGWPADQQRAAECLEFGRVYTLERFEIGGWQTYLWLREVPGYVFNSVQFAEAES